MDSIPGIPSIIVKPPVLQKEQVSVEARGEHVLVHIGNSTLTMHYNDALKLSQWIRVRAKQAKRLMGDVSQHWSAIAVLDDMPKYTG